MSSPAATRSGRRCAKCDQSLTSTAIMALNELWHPTCFTCAICNTELSNNFQSHERKVYCAKCFAEKFHPRCAKCKALLQQSCITAMGASWHPTCFVCATCNKPFSDGIYYIHNEQPYCVDHFWAKQHEKYTEEKDNQQKGVANIAADGKK